MFLNNIEYLLFSMSSKRRYSKSSSSTSVGAAVGRAVNAGLRAQKRAEQYNAAKKFLNPMMSGGMKDLDFDPLGRANAALSRTKYSGSGAYSLGKGLRGLAGYARSLGNVGKVLGTNTITKALRDKARAAVDTIPSGMGMYGGQGAYVANALMSGGKMSGLVYGAGDESDTITISDLEYVQDIYASEITSGTSPFASQSIPIQPGVHQFCPNLAQLACNFSEYEIKQCVVEWRPTISESNSNTNGQSGTVMLVTQYNVNDEALDDKESVMQYHGSVSGRIIDKLVMGVECDPAKNRGSGEYFIRSGPVPQGRDIDEYDHGRILVCTNNVPSAFSNQIIAELHIFYTVVLRKRKAGAMRLVNQQVDFYVAPFNVTVAQLMSTQIGNNTIQGVLVAQQSTIGGLLSNTSNANLAKGLTYTLPAFFSGRIEIQFRMSWGAFTGATNDATMGIITPNANASGKSIFAVNDVIGGSDSPQNSFRAGNIELAQGTSGAIASGNVTVIYHFEVKSAIGNIPNSFQISTGFITSTTGTVSNWSLDVREYTSLLSTKKDVNGVRLFPTTNNYSSQEPMALVAA